jgi:hypothetical protein
VCEFVSVLVKERERRRRRRIRSAYFRGIFPGKKTKKKKKKKKKKTRENDDNRQRNAAHVYNLALFLGDYRRRFRERRRRRRFLIDDFDVFLSRRTRAGHAHAVDHSHRERYARDASEKNARDLHHFIARVRVCDVCVCVRAPPTP